MSCHSKARFCLLVSLAAAAAFAGRAAEKESVERGRQRMEIALERLENSAWREVDSGLVFDNGDRIRFRVTTNFSGRLYVMNQGTSGEYGLLFPREDTGTDNRIEAGREYVIPATEGAFRVTGPPGHDIVYWMVSPVALGQGEGPEYAPLPPPPAPGEVPPALEPRCDDTLFRARGECIDTSAGARQVEKDRELPENLAKTPGLRPRQLVFMKKDKKSVVAAPEKLKGPVVFEFRLAHR